MAGARWPWQELRHRPDVTMQLVDFPPGPVQALSLLRGPTKVVLIDRSLPRAERRVALGHELVHLERGPVPRGAPGWIVAKEERHVDAIAAQRLVPVVELRRFVAARASVGPVSASDIAEHFDVSLAVAIRACEQIRTTGTTNGHRTNTDSTSTDSTSTDSTSTDSTKTGRTNTASARPTARTPTARTPTGAAPEAARHVR